MNKPSLTAMLRAGMIGAVALLLSGCVPRIEVAVSKEPITINMNVKIEHEIKVSADRDAAQLLERSGDRATTENTTSRVETTTREQIRTQTLNSALPEKAIRVDDAKKNAP